MQTTTLLKTALVTTTLLTLTATAAAQQVVVRDTLVALPPISICQDGATHQTVVTKQRLRPNGNNLAALVGRGVEIAGTPGAVTCRYLTVTSARALAADQSSKTSRPSNTLLQIDFFGTAPAGSLYTVFVGVDVASTPLLLPGINGPIHLGLTAFFRLPGVFMPQGATTPYTTIVFPLVPNVVGIDFYDQAVALVNGVPEMTNIDTFRW